MSSPAADRVRFRLPRPAYVAVVFLGLGITPFVRAPALAVLYVVPLLVALFIARRGTDVDSEQVVIRGLFGSRRMAWDSVRGLLIRPRGAVAVVTTDATVTVLPYVRLRHVALVAELSGGRLPDPSVPRPAEVVDPSS